MTGVVLAIIGVLVALYQATGIAKDNWAGARERSLEFCRRLADTAEKLVVDAVGPVGIVKYPPVPASLLVYLRDGLVDDMKVCFGRQLGVWEGEVHGYVIKLAEDVSSTCVALHLWWEDASGARVTRFAEFPPPPPDRKPKPLPPAFESRAWFLR